MMATDMTNTGRPVDSSPTDKPLMILQACPCLDELAIDCTG